MATSFQLTFDAADPLALAQFWSEVLGYVREPPPEGFASWDDWLIAMEIPEDRWTSVATLVDPDGLRPRIFIQRVPEPKTAKNRMHLDVNCGGERGTAQPVRRSRVDAEVDRLVALGAVKVSEGGEFGEYHVVMRDPEGNEFCLQ
jgi:hypothetical protein